MNCPVCRETALVMSERSGIEIDYCSQCRGVWLDRGELDKIIERAAGGAAPAVWEATQTPLTPPDGPPHHRTDSPGRHEARGHDARRYDRDEDDDDPPYRRGRKRGFLGDLFDFD